ncbi:MAG: hypothetical protein MI922_22170 [Bacteroidales bacterium]|nr:hypothetical protein [Bacteroidales bacterium]
MEDVNYRRIKERMKSRSLDLWGVENPNLMDPVIELLFDVFSYELSKIYQDVKLSDSKLLERLSKILVRENWSLPMPAHALLHTQPSESIMEIDEKSGYYLQKVTQSGVLDVIFTPLAKQKLVNARVYCAAFNKQLVFYSDNSEPQLTLKSYTENKLPDYNMWIGIEVEKHLLNRLEEIPLCILLHDSGLIPFIKLARAYDSNGQELELLQKVAEEDKVLEHYYTSVYHYYREFLYTLRLKEGKRNMQDLIGQVGEFFDHAEMEEFNKELYWIKLEFPVAFVKDELEKVEPSINTYPVVNRRPAYKQHSVTRNGKIVSLNTREKEYFLNIKSLIDDKGSEYKSALQNSIDRPDCSYSLYTGVIEQFDERNAKAVLNQVIQTVREEGSSFSAVGYDIINAHLEDLKDRLDLLEQKVNYRFKNVNDDSDRLYLLTIPFSNSEQLECNYWNTLAEMANGIEKTTVLSQYQSGGIKAESIILKTDSTGGMLRRTTQNQVNNLRFGLLSKDRIVSNEDIKGHIKTIMGENVQSVKIESGVSISTNPKQGLIRTINVNIQTAKAKFMNDEDKHRMAHSIQLELQNKSVHNTPYKVNIY